MSSYFLAMLEVRSKVPGKGSLETVQISSQCLKFPERKVFRWVWKIKVRLAILTRTFSSSFILLSWDSYFFSCLFAYNCLNSEIKCLDAFIVCEQRQARFPPGTAETYVWDDSLWPESSRDLVPSKGVRLGRKAASITTRCKWSHADNFWYYWKGSFRDRVPSKSQIFVQRDHNQI